MVYQLQFAGSLHEEDTVLVLNALVQVDGKRLIVGVDLLCLTTLKVTEPAVVEDRKKSLQVVSA